MDETFMFTPKEYRPALELAINAHKGPPAEIVDFYYDDYSEIFVLMVDENKSRYNLTLEGAFVRSCYKAVKDGITSWS